MSILFGKSTSVRKWRGKRKLGDDREDDFDYRRNVEVTPANP
jgi:hypothetical protein